MFAEGFIAEHIFEILGLFVTIGGIWLVVTQLRETRRATEVEAILGLYSKYDDLWEDFLYIGKLIWTEKWERMSSKEAFEYINSSPKRRKTYSRVLGFGEALGLLVNRNSIDFKVAYQFAGTAFSQDFRRVEKTISQERIERNFPEVWDMYEWLALEIEEYAESLSKN